ncbi:MAG: 2-C-methyl-D-erythritol 4-phosphate cytidylyltransferase [Clostridiales bacterium]|nr:2-C-methyl-D-erythritol 4-phosphate cytidylyltransferase [Candidatus Blautia equi]
MPDKCTAIVLAAGRGKRMKTNIQKQFLEVQGHPLIYYSLRAFQESAVIDEIVLVTSEDAIEFCRGEIVEKYGFSKVKKIIPGGKERYDSVYEGLLACEDCSYVFIHDGARPFVTEEILMRGYEDVKLTGACVIGMPSKDTIKIADENGFVSETPKRSLVWNIQTPQIFRYDLIRSAHESIRKKDMSNVTDDAMVVEQETGVGIKLTEGSYTNMKVTTPEDITVAENILKKGVF